jgi:hypothetical protein
MSLPATKYPTNMRVVTGTPIIYNDDVVLLCDTSAGAVTINLLDIPNGYWSTQYKLYVIDYSNNAGTNNITINAGSGQTINNASSVVINSNGGQYLVRISSDTSYIAEYNGCCGGSGILGLHFVTNSELLTAISGSTLVQGDFYIVTDVTNADTYVMLQSITTNAIATDGSGYFLNADYQNVGNYSDVSGFVAQNGLWNSGATYSIGDVVIYDNFHWENISGTNGGSPSITPADWSQLSKSITNGYISEVDFVVYDPVNNLIKTRYDFRNNEVDYYNNGGGRVTLVDFPFGNNNVTYNKIKGTSTCYFCNSPSAFVGNSLVNGNLTDNTNISSGATGQVSYNVIQNGTITITLNLGSVSDNLVNSDCSITINGSISANGSISYNVLNSSSYISIGVLAGTTTIKENNLSAESYIQVDNGITLTNSFIKGNTISANSYVRVQANATGNNIWQNVINSYSYLTTTGAHTGNVRGNNINLSSYITIGSGAGGSDLSGNEVYDFSYIQIGSSVTQIDGNILRYQSHLIATSVTAGNFITANEILFNSTFTITTNGGDTIGNKLEQNSSITLGTTSSDFLYNQATQGGQFNISTLSAVCSYCVATDGQIVTQTITATTTNKVARQGYSNWEWNLDFNDLSVYNLTLVTIPTAQSYVGIFNIVNGATKVVTSIANAPSKQRFQFRPADTSFTLTAVAVGGAVANNIIQNYYTNVGGGANTITYRANGGSYVLFETQGNLIGVVEKNSWA